MVFNSFEFAVFLFLVYGLYLLLQAAPVVQNRMLLAASFVFYGWWDWRFLFLLTITIVTDFFAARAIAKSEQDKHRKLYLALSVGVNLTILGFFKYFNFMASSVTQVLDYWQLSVHPWVLEIVLPVGISFYTFQSMSYTIDVYRRKMPPAKHLLDYALFVSFFPQLVAGPIERASHLLPQILKPRTLVLTQFYEGSYLIGWGLFKKVFVADNLAKFVDPVFQSAGPYDGLTVLFALYAFAFQIYCDFSGYSDIARGIGKCMGFDIMINFRLPYFSSNPSEFWQRWHISFSQWLRDYLYIPLGGNRFGKLMTFRNLLITMLLGGLWHGARWNFVLWGAYHGFLLILYRLLEGIKPKSAITSTAGWRGFQIILFFHLTCFGWLLFRAAGLEQIGLMLQALAHLSIPSAKYLLTECLILGFYTGPLLLVQIFQSRFKDLSIVLRMPVIVRSAFYLVCFYLFIIYGATGGKEFIYFQF